MPGDYTYRQLKNAYGENVEQYDDISSSLFVDDDANSILTKQSSDLVKKLSDYIPSELTKEAEITKNEVTDQIFGNFYDYFKESYSYVQTNFDINKDLKCSKITKRTDIPVPSGNELSYVDKFFQNIIYASLKNSYSCSLKSPFGNGRIINIYFVSAEKQNKIHDYFQRILIWIFIISKYTENRDCSRILNIYIYLTDPIKTLPENEENEEVIGKQNVNTGFTTSCSPNSNIVIYRKEEWFKVFIHESIHNFGLDFSEMENKNTREYILNIFPISSKVKLYETYTDFWARTSNCMFCSFYGILKKNRIHDGKQLFIENTYKHLNDERNFSYLQVAKILNFMKLDYEDLYTNNYESEVKRFLFYKENTSVFAYYILCCVLFNKFNDFIAWCVANNESQQILLQFNKTKENQISFCKFIESNYDDKPLLNILSSVKDKLNKEKNNRSKSSELFYRTLMKSINSF